MLRLQSGESSLVLMPETGAAFAGWMIGARPLLRYALPDAIVHGSVRGLAGFPLLPFCNRIGYGRFRWEGREYQLARNFGDHPHSIHGVGWQRAWGVRHVSDSTATLELEHTGAGAETQHWPFAFAATLHARLTSDALRIGLTITNRHTGPAPAGLGLHPYFPRASFATLHFSAAGVWHTGDDALPSTHGPVPPEWNHNAGKPIGNIALDHCFTGWDGVADIIGEAVSLRLEASPALRHLQVYTPPGQDFFCVEPVSHMPNAINEPEHPMRTLAPGESLAAEIAMYVQQNT